ncbi:MAG: DUF5676 family membrane protein [Thermoanaerobaculia bacterium]|nr:DUF5676 family membrane protein [Thermoanaerobaculia bacterium]
MKLQARALALASGTVAATLFAFCALFVALVPEAAVWATRALFHVAVASPPTLAGVGFVAGLVFWFAGAAASAATLAGLYNRWVKP